MDHAEQAADRRGVVCLTRSGHTKHSRSTRSYGESWVGEYDNDNIDNGKLSYVLFYCRSVLVGSLGMTSLNIRSKLEHGKSGAT